MLKLGLLRMACRGWSTATYEASLRFFGPRSAGVYVGTSPVRTASYQGTRLATTSLARITQIVLARV